MKEYQTSSIRNVSVVAHAGVGKTSLIEAMLYAAGAIERMGAVGSGTTVSDHDPDEISRQTTLAATPCIVEWRDRKMNILDTPGYEDFYGELESALSVSDAALVLVDAAQGVEGGTEKVWDAAVRHGLPRAIVVNRMDAEGADLPKALASIREALGLRPVLLHVPVGSGVSFSGVVDVLGMRSLAYTAGERSPSEGSIPEDVQGLVEESREQLIEAAAEGEDDLTEKYLQGEELTPSELIRGLRAAVRNGVAVPVLCAAATGNTGVSAVLDFIVDVFPSPAESPVTALLAGEEVQLEADPNGPLAARVFKTIADPYAGRLSLFRVYSGTLGVESVQNTTRSVSERIAKVAHPHGRQQVDAAAVVAGDIGCVVKLANTGTGDTLARADKPLRLPTIEFPRPTLALAVFPMTEGDEDRLSSALGRIADEDPSFVVGRNADTKELIVSGLGDMHIAVALDRAKRKFNANARTAPPQIAYRETITRAAKGVEYTHKKQTGGAGQYARVVVDVEPLPRGAGYEFVDRIFGGAIDQPFRPSVDKGVQAAMAEGVLAKYPVVDLRLSLVDGKTHPVDSKDIAFQIAGREVFKKAVQTAGLVLLEPIMNVDILVPEDAVGDVMGDLNARRGRVMGMEQQGSKQLIRAQVPLAEMARYHTDLKGMTRARGSFTMELAQYEEVPRDQQEKIVAARQS
jgi:elongation factor G